MRTRNREWLILGMLTAGLLLLQPSPIGAQVPKSARDQGPAQSIVTVEQPDAQRTREELARLLEHYPPTLRATLALDPTLLGNQPYLAPYPGLVSFLNAHPEIARNPSFYVGEAPHPPQDAATQAVEMWGQVFKGLTFFAVFGTSIGLLGWLTRTLVDYRRWSRLAKVQLDVHTKLLDRFTANDDLLAYIHSPAGSRFLESSPIKLDAGPRTVGAPLGRILWSLQGGMVLMSGGIGMQIVGGRLRDEVAQPFHALGILAIALGVGLIVSAIISYVISQRLGLIEPKPLATRSETTIA